MTSLRCETIWRTGFSPSAAAPSSAAAAASCTTLSAIMVAEEISGVSISYATAMRQGSYAAAAANCVAASPTATGL